MENPGIFVCLAGRCCISQESNTSNATEEEPEAGQWKRNQSKEAVPIRLEAITTSHKKLVVTSASLLVTSALLVVIRS